MDASIHATDYLRAHMTPRAGDAEVTDIDTVRMLRAASAHQRRRAARSRDLTALLRDRPDLVGVYAPADVAADAVHWCI
jgi:hypothetical protein